MHRNKIRGVFFLSMILLICWCMIITGCGSSGSSLNLSPEQLEVVASVDAFTSSVADENLTQSMSLVFSNIKYYGGTTSDQILTYSDFSTRLSNFFNLASAVECSIGELGVDITSDTTASVRGLLSLNYNNAAGYPNSLTENIELKMEKNGSLWGITEFSRYGSSGTTNTAFPPQS